VLLGATGAAYDRTMSGPLTRFGIAVESREQRQEKILAGVIASV